MDLNLLDNFLSMKFPEFENQMILLRLSMTVGMLPVVAPVFNLPSPEEERVPMIEFWPWLAQKVEKKQFMW